MASRLIRFREVNRDIFLAICQDEKTLETRAATPKYQKISRGDSLIFICGKDKITKNVRSSEHFESIETLLQKYRPEEINPKTRSAEEARKMWYSFPGYREKIDRYGLVVWELE